MSSSSASSTLAIHTFVEASPDGAFVVFAYGGIVKVWAFAEASFVESADLRTRANAGLIRFVEFNEAYMLLGVDKTVFLWDWKTWTVVGSLEMKKTISAAAFVHDGKVVVADKYGDVYLVSCPGLGSAELAFGHLAVVNEMCAVPAMEEDEYAGWKGYRGPCVVTCDTDHKARVSRYPQTFVVNSFLLHHTEAVTAMAIARHTESKVTFVLTGGADGSVCVWNLRSGALVDTVNLNEHLKAHDPCAETSGASEDGDEPVIGVGVSQILYSESHGTLFVAAHPIPEILIYELRLENVVMNTEDHQASLLDTGVSLVSKGAVELQGYPSDIALRNDEQLWVAAGDPRIAVFDLSGQPVEVANQAQLIAGTSGDVDMSSHAPIVEFKIDYVKQHDRRIFKREESAKRKKARQESADGASPKAVPSGQAGDDGDDDDDDGDDGNGNDDDDDDDDDDGNGDEEEG